jgi:hypothetical protein
VDDSFGYCIFRFVGSAVGLEWILLLLVACNVFQLLSLLIEKLVHFFLVLDNSLGDDLPMLNSCAGLTTFGVVLSGFRLLIFTDMLRFQY